MFLMKTLAMPGATLVATDISDEFLKLVKAKF
jgi:hypothetical protein